LEKSKYPDLETEVNAFASKRDIETNPGTQIFFSQIGPDIAARVLEVVTKKTFDRCVSDKILRPCKMRSTSFTNDNGLVTTPQMALLLLQVTISISWMLLNKGTFEGKKVLSEKSIAEWKPPSLLPFRLIYAKGSVRIKNRARLLDGKWQHRNQFKYELALSLR